MFQSIDPSSPPYIEPPFICDYVSVTAACIMYASLCGLGRFSVMSSALLRIDVAFPSFGLM